MILSFYFLSLICLIFGWIYYYKPSFAQAVNAYFRNKIFNDRYILLKRKRLAVIFFVFAVLFFTSALVITLEQKNRQNTINRTETTDIFFDIISVYTANLADNPDDLNTLSKLADAYAAIGEQKREITVLKKILDLDPKNEKAKKRLQSEY